MIDQFKKLLNEDQDPKAVEKIAEKLQDIIMHHETVCYIAVQKKPAITVFPDSIVLTDKRIILCKPKNLGFSMEFQDFDWEEVVSPFIKENLLGAEFSFMTSTDLSVTMDYLPKTQARKLYTFAKEQLDARKNLSTNSSQSVAEEIELYDAEVLPTETNFSSQENTTTQNAFSEDNIDREASFFQDETTALSVKPPFETTEPLENSTEPENIEPLVEQDALEANVSQQVEQHLNKEGVDVHSSELSTLSKEELFDKLMSYKKLLDHGLILPAEYDALKAEIIKHL